jgi:hypothetical protein
MQSDPYGADSKERVSISPICKTKLDEQVHVYGHEEAHAGKLAQPA